MRKIYFMPALLLALLFALTGCRGEDTQAMAAMEEVSIREAVTVADPETALQKLYEALPDAIVTDLTANSFYEYFPELSGVVDEYYGRISNVRGGLADVFLIRPKESEGSGRSNRDEVRDALRTYQERRIREFENYDILDAFSIATEAEVFDQGEYVVMLMLPDNEFGREVIDQYMPL